MTFFPPFLFFSLTSAKGQHEEPEVDAASGGRGHLPANEIRRGNGHRRGHLFSSLGICQDGKKESDLANGRPIGLIGRAI